MPCDLLRVQALLYQPVPSTAEVLLKSSEAMSVSLNAKKIYAHMSAHCLTSGLPNKQVLDMIAERANAQHLSCANLRSVPAPLPSPSCDQLGTAVIGHKQRINNRGMQGITMMTMHTSCAGGV